MTNFDTVGKPGVMFRKTRKKWKREWIKLVKGMEGMRGMDEMKEMMGTGGMGRMRRKKLREEGRKIQGAEKKAAGKIHQAKQEMGEDIRRKLRRKRELAGKAAGVLRRMEKPGTPGMEPRTDLALEEKERFPGDGGEIKGVSLREWYQKERQIKVTEVKILNAQGARAMGKEMGTYLTIEARGIGKGGEELEKKLADELALQIRKLAASGSGQSTDADPASGSRKAVDGDPASGFRKPTDAVPASGSHQLSGNQGRPGAKLPEKILVVGLGNLYVTPDSLGPRVLQHLRVTRHYDGQFGDGFLKEHGMASISGIAPGVMAQTGMETAEILKGVVNETKPELVIAIDALSARSVHRLGCTIQLSDTGIRPGSGVGNHRDGLVEETLGVPVLAVGVPTVVGAAAIVQDTMEAMVKALEMGKNTRGAGQYLSGLNPDEQYALIRELLEPEFGPMFVTPPDIDEQVERLGRVIAEAVELAFV